MLRKKLFYDDTVKAQSLPQGAACKLASLARLPLRVKQLEDRSTELLKFYILEFYEKFRPILIIIYLTFERYFILKPTWDSAGILTVTR